ncbi:unnamed protein product [Chondrus crispus]|uniref:Uncharacterized protein n=1 Tax=Chondrus crispus TaxID=2769 RepID=R7Q525_CHOCR|nr:unnamed protein product [Chondrus crispus]CDF33119.1 unnamed protein product [Chondrus crispus]|eukprot:XP_005712922.1 unnamed protein product [Chondrus crispus]
MTSTICCPRGQLKRTFSEFEQARAARQVYINEVAIRSSAYLFCSWKKSLDDACRAWLTIFGSTTLQDRKSIKLSDKKQSYIYAATRPLRNPHHSVHCGLPRAHPCTARGRSRRKTPYIGHMFPFLCQGRFQDDREVHARSKRFVMHMQ